MKEYILNNIFISFNVLKLKFFIENVQDKVDSLFGEDLKIIYIKNGIINVTKLLQLINE